MSQPAEYLPDVYVRFREYFPQVATAQDALAQEVAAASPFDERTARLLKLALGMGAQAPGAVRSNARRALSAGVSPGELRAVAVMAITTCGFPTSIAGLKWIDEVIGGEAERP